uniref:Activin_recp domain-containing protein n=1 Tax=Strongyloides papillosus TaxID=174720 RepID=A0A0N5B8S0_STREA
MKILYLFLAVSLTFSFTNGKEIECQRFCKYLSGDLEFVQSYCLSEVDYEDNVCLSTEELGCSIAKMNFDGTLILAGGCPTPEFITQTGIKKNDCGYFETFLNEDEIQLSSKICRCHEGLCNNETAF